MTKTYIDELAEEIGRLREENERLKEENRALAMGSFPLMIEGANKIEKLKELLKECQHIMKIEKDFASCHFEKTKLDELLTKIDEALK